MSRRRKDARAGRGKDAGEAHAYGAPWVESVRDGERAMPFPFDDLAGLHETDARLNDLATIFGRRVQLCHARLTIFLNAV